MNDNFKLLTVKETINGMKETINAKFICNLHTALVIHAMYDL